MMRKSCFSFVGALFLRWFPVLLLATSISLAADRAEQSTCFCSRKLSLLLIIRYWDHCLTLLINRKKGVEAGALMVPGFNEILEPERDFAYAKIPGTAGNFMNTCFINEDGHLLVVSTAGLFFSFYIDNFKGGNCQLKKQVQIQHESLFSD